MKWTNQEFRAWLRHFAELIDEHQHYLTDLDAAIGDADHGTNMARGTAAMAAALPDQGSSAELARQAGMSLVSQVGGASGPLFGTLLLKLAPGLGEAADLQDLAQAFTDAAQAVAARGKSTAGEKTMLDALLPAAEALASAAAEGDDLRAGLQHAAAAAEQGAAGTVEMRATKGRASYLGERSVGHQDPGATSVAYLMQALAASVGES